MSTNLFNLSLIKGNSEQLKGHCCCIIPEELCEFTTMSMPLVVDRYKGDTAAFQKSKGDIADFQKFSAQALQYCYQRLDWLYRQEN